MSGSEASPSHSPTPKSAVAVERRKAPRYLINRPVALSLASQIVDARLVDLSVGGALIQTTGPRRPSMPVGITLLVGEVSKTLPARVLRGQTDGPLYNLGCEFLPLTRGEQEHLRRFLQEYAPATPSPDAQDNQGLPTRVSLVFERADVSPSAIERL